MRGWRQSVIANERHKIAHKVLIEFGYHILKGGNLFAADKPIWHVEDDEYGREKYVDNTLPTLF